MLGFTARVADATSATPGEELESVTALTRSELNDALGNSTLKVPPPQALAGSLINDWLKASPHQPSAYTRPW